MSAIQPATSQTPETVTHKDMANALRALAMDAVQKANSGHPAMPIGMADRARFILSAGHGSMLLYGLLHLTGYEKMTLDEIKNFRQMKSLPPGHPEVMQDIGIETTTGPLGQGVANGVGFALAERLMHARFGSEIVNHFTYVIAGD